MASFCHALSSYRGPLIVIGIGVGFMLVGAIPVAVTFSLDAKSSATIIGVGFIGFGLLLVLPGVVWCVVRRTVSLCCHSRGERLRDSTAPEAGQTKRTPTALRTSPVRRPTVPADECQVRIIPDRAESEDDDVTCDVTYGVTCDVTGDKQGDVYDEEAVSFECHDDSDVKSMTT